jgi:hypothetical protein
MAQDMKTDKKKLQGLQRVADVMLDHSLLSLRAARLVQEETRAKLLALDRHDADYGCTPQAAARAQMLYDTWADSRRAALNQNLTIQTAAVQTAQDVARQAFGKQNALKRLQSRQP